MLVRYLLKVIDAWRAKMKKYRLKITPAIIPTERHKIEDVLKELIGKVGENMKIVRFVRFELGEK